MLHVSMSLDLPASAADVWEVIGGFGALPSWHPAIESCELSGDGKQRKLFLAGGAIVIENLESLDDAARAYSYSIVEAPLPLADYIATLEVRDRKGGSTVEWSSDFNAAGAPDSEALEIVRGVYQAGFDSLTRMFSP